MVIRALVLAVALALAACTSAEQASADKAACKAEPIVQTVDTIGTASDSALGVFALPVNLGLGIVDTVDVALCTAASAVVPPAPAAPAPQ
jgi:hypothetical protein